MEINRVSAVRFMKLGLTVCHQSSDNKTTHFSKRICSIVQIFEVKNEINPPPLSTIVTHKLADLYRIVAGTLLNYPPNWILSTPTTFFRVISLSSWENGSHEAVGKKKIVLDWGEKSLHPGKFRKQIIIRWHNIETHAFIRLFKFWLFYKFLALNAIFPDCRHTSHSFDQMIVTSNG